MKFLNKPTNILNGKSVATLAISATCALWNTYNIFIAILLKKVSIGTKKAETYWAIKSEKQK